MIGFGNPRRWRRRGDQLRDARRWAEAAAAYRRWLASDPADAAIWIQLGHVLGEAGDHAAAAAAYAHAAALRPDDAAAPFHQAHMEERRGDRARALDLFRQSLALGHPDAATGVAALAPTALEPEPEPDQAETSAEADAPAAPEPEPEPSIGACEYRDREVVHGWLQPADGADHVRFLADGRLVGVGWPAHGHRRGDGWEFRTLLAVSQPTEVRAERASDGRALAGSPFLARPALDPAVPPSLATAARHRTLKPLGWAPGTPLALLVTHCATGLVKPHVLPYVRALAAAGIATLVVVQADGPVDPGDALLDAAAGVLVRDNLGYDFAAWAHALALHPEAWGASLLLLLNDSVLPATAGDRLANLLARVRQADADVVGLTDSHEYRWHIQSYFLAFKPAALSTWALQRFFGEVPVLHDKDEIIRHFELPLAEMAEAAGLRVALLYPGRVALNPVLNEWDRLLRDGFPFVKLLLLRGAFPHIDLHGWRDRLAAAEFDLELVDAVLHAAAEQPPRDDNGDLAARRVASSAGPAGPLKVALFGPWNYDNGLGHACRGLVGSLRHAGVRLSLHPVEHPFHVHRPLALPTAIRDFAGPADVAIVHLNPDSWHLLTPAQLAEIAAAGRRIGYWVWEMDHIPDAWWDRFGAVDRIWAPSRYCAERFARADGPPVAVLPHAVPLPPLELGARAQTLRGLGIDPARRVILYLFDGSSYLVRKNPAALVRAFAASGLAGQGWTLLLKTKHLHDRPDEGRRFAELAAGEAGVVLLDRALDAGALAALVAACDIYASPHCAEGFGLTVAEALAAGRQVVATDYSGTTDLLDDTTGFPVRWHPWRLEEDHGHYTSGGVWARVDEPALTQALLRAAAAVDANDWTRGQAGRARVADRLSYRAVGARIAALLADDTIHPFHEPVRTRGLNLHAGVALDRNLGDPGIAILPLAADGAPVGRMAVPDGADWLVLAPAGSRLSPLTAATLRDGAAARLDVAIFYADDVAGEVAAAIDQFRLKPAFDRTLLATQDYVGAPVMVRRDAWEALGGLRPEFGTAAVIDLLFRADEAGWSIARLPEILLAHPGARVVATPADHARALAAQPALAAFRVAPGRTAATLRLDRRYPPDGEPPVTLLVPTRNTPLPDGSGTWIGQLLDRIAQTDWPMAKLHVLVGDDAADAPAWAQAAWPFALTRLATQRAPGEPFNYAAKMNRLWRAADTEQVVFMNDDLVPGDSGWLRALQTYALDRSVGGVGARLLFPDGRLQHAGMVPHGAGAVHAWVFRDRVAGTFHDWALTAREWSMVTGALFATRRSLLDEVNGFDEGFGVEFNDTDLCLRLRALGLRIVCTPFAEMIHAEKQSRGEAPPAGDTIARFRTRWAGWLADDPSFHPLLRRDRFDLRPDISQRQWFF